jgi:dihydrofolate reductase
VPKLVASRTLTAADMSVWSGSTVLDGDLVDVVKQEQREVVVTGSLSVVEQLRAADLVDEYRLLTFPTVLGSGARLFPVDGPQVELECLGADQVGAAVLARYRRTAG